MRVRWSLTDPAQPLPAGIDLLEFVAEYEGAPEGGVPWGSTVANLEDSDGNGRVEDVSPPLPTGIPITIRITGVASGAPAYVGHVGPIVLSPGERRYVEPAMFRVGTSTALVPGAMSGRILHTSTALPDGRVLVAGGFTGVRSTSCPDDVAMGARCFDLEGADDAYVYDPTSARFHPVQGGMLEARGGHTATALPDGRVLLAGGASEAVLVMTPQGSVDATTGYAISILPRDAEGASSALATFELFDPEANAELEDVDADGDPGRGGFVGAADAPRSPGRLDHARFFATASAVPGTGRVVIAGGGGGDPAATATFTVFDADRAGGYGVLGGGDTALVTPRLVPGSAAVGSGSSASVWIVGGTDAQDDSMLAEVWSASASDPIGASAPASEEPLLFPQQMAGVPASHPEWSLLRPIVEAIGTAGHIAVIGWYGPLCPVGDTTAVFAGGADPVERCGFARRSFTIDVETGLAQPTATNSPHAFGAAARLDDGRVLVTGGIGSLIWSANGAIDVLTGAIGGDGAAVVSPTPLTLTEARAFHTSTGLPDGGALTVGGLRFDASVMNATLPAPEVIYLAPR